MNSYFNHATANLAKTPTDSMRYFLTRQETDDVNPNATNQESTSSQVALFPSRSMPTTPDTEPAHQH
ncbi:hypothetical protein [Richelia sinica]|nr:hypothetical protein [Richelia sinica]MBD2665565.1 hypothetical protein [Richelia sinica FACHB-800]